MEDQLSPRGESETAKSEAILTELFGPLAHRICGGGLQTAYINLLVSSVFLRHRARSSWAVVREEVRKAVDAQSAPQDLLRMIGRWTDVVLREHGLPLGTSAALDELRGNAIDDLAHVVGLCEYLKPEDYPALLDHFGAWVGANDGTFFTPRSVVKLIVQTMKEQLEGTIRIHDPYVRGGELLAGTLETGARVELSGSSPSDEMLRIAGMNLLLNGGEVDLSSGTTTPWNHPVTPGVDWILANPPFNSKGSATAKSWKEDWIFGPPPAHNENYAWLQHIIASLRRPGRATVLMPNQAAVSIDSREQLIRRRMIQRGAVEFMVALPRQLFTTTAIPTMIWGLRSPSAHPDSILFMDIRRAGSKRGRQRILTPTEIEAISECLRSWRAGAEDFSGVMQDIGKATAASIREIEEQDYSLDPSDYLSSQLSGLADFPIASITELADAVKLRIQEARIADEKSSSIVVENLKKDGAGLHSDWNKVKLDEICQIQAGPSHSIVKKASRAEYGVPLIVPSNLRDRRILAGNAERITVDAARDLERFQVKENDILFVRTGSVGPVALMTESEERWLFGTNLMRLRCNDGVAPGYLLAFLSSDPAQRWIQARTESATAIPSISAKSLGKLPVTLPPPGEQRRVSDLLTRVDMQIAAHRNLAETAEKWWSMLTDGLTSGLLVAPGPWDLP